MQPPRLTAWVVPYHADPHQDRSAQQTALPADQRIQPIRPRVDVTLPKDLPPADFWRGVRGEPLPSDHQAPPSLMQIAITRLLEEQRPARPPEDGKTARPADQTSDGAQSARSAVFNTLP